MDLVMTPVPPGHGDGAGPAARRAARRPRCGADPRVVEAYLGGASHDARRSPSRRSWPATSPGCRSCTAPRSASRAARSSRILGPNGAGKSTLVKAMAGLVPVVGGRVRLRRARRSPRVPAHRLVARGPRLRAADRERLRQPRRSRRISSSPRPLLRSPRGERLAAAVRALPRPRAPAPACRPGGCRAGSGRCWRWRAR